MRLVDGLPVLRRLEQDVLGLGPIDQALVDEKLASRSLFMQDHG